MIVDFAAQELLAKSWRYFKNNTNCPRLCDLCCPSVLKSLTRLSAEGVGGADRKFWRREKEKPKKKATNVTENQHNSMEVILFCKVVHFNAPHTQQHMAKSIQTPRQILHIFC